jgi:hypothetical protein
MIYEDQALDFLAMFVIHDIQAAGKYISSSVCMYVRGFEILW